MWRMMSSSFFSQMSLSVQNISSRWSFAGSWLSHLSHWAIKPERSAHFQQRQHLLCSCACLFLHPRLVVAYKVILDTDMLKKSSDEFAWLHPGSSFFTWDPGFLGERKFLPFRTENRRPLWPGVDAPALSPTTLTYSRKEQSLSTQHPPWLRSSSVMTGRCYRSLKTEG